MNYTQRIAGYRNAAPAFNNAAGVVPSAVSVANQLDPNDRTLTFNIINSDTAAAATVTLFGAVKDLTDATLPASLTVNVLESSHLSVKTQILAGDSFRILGMKMSVANASQFTNTWSIYRENSTGALLKKTFQPLTFRSAQNNLTTQVDGGNFELVVDAKTYIQFSVNASENITIIFSQIERANMTGLLTGSAVREISTNPAPTGLPQIDNFVYQNQATMSLK